MKKNILIFAVLLALAFVPVTCSFLFTGSDEDGQPKVQDVVRRPTGGDDGRSVTPVGGLMPVPTPVPVFKGFENPRYQQYDAVIARLTDDFNRNRAKWIGGTDAQGKGVAEITTAQVKAHMIQETGGGDVNSRAAWARDPLQVNVPGDWNPYKKYLGLKEPRRRNEGSFEKNLRAGIMLLARKGFGVSGQPAGNRADGAFDGWSRALQRYNGRSDKTADGRKYSEVYSERISQRAISTSEVEIPILTKKRR